jgi:hypothetical protein
MLAKTVHDLADPAKPSLDGRQRGEETMIDIARCAASVHTSETIKHKLLRLGVVGLLGIGALAAASGAQAASTGITQVTIQKSGVAFGGCSIGNIGTFNYVQGYALDVIDPANPLNTVITDIGNAQKDANGYVDVLFNFYIVLPTNLANGNGKIIADIPNRSNKTATAVNRNPINGVNGATASMVTNDPAAFSAAPGSGNCSALQNTFFWGQGYAVMAGGWEADPGTDPTSATLSTSLTSTGLNSGLSAVGVLNGNTLTPLTTMPIAVGSGGATLTGPGYEYIVVGANTSSFNMGGGLTTSNYPASPLGATCSTLSSSNGTLTWRHHLDDTATVLPTADWQYNAGADGNCDSISLTAAAATAGYAVAVGQTVGVSTCTSSLTGACFLSQDIYELSYTAANPTVNLAGAAVIRDFYSWLKGNSGSASGNPFTTGYIKDIYSWTSSQPARTINDYLHLGFNGDLNGKRVFDGMVNWIGAGAGLSWTYRWSHTTETERNRQQHLWVESFFPFADATTTDPISGTTDGRYAKCTANNTCPLMNLVQYSANEYWVKTASLLHTDPTGSFDLPDAMHPLSRYYYMSSMQHGGGTQSSKTSTGVCQNFNNPTDPEYTERALYLALDQYVNGGLPVPSSQVPTLAGGTLVSPQALNFPSGYMQMVTGINSGNPFPVLYTALETTRYRFNMGSNFYQTLIPTINPPVITPPFENNRANGQIYPSYVPATNSDGNDVSGIQLAELLAPVATYAGWNYRSGSTNAPTPQNDGPDGCESTGSYIGFYPTLTARQAASDPRPSITERFPTYAAYQNAAVAAVDKLVWNRFMVCGYDVSSPYATPGSGGGGYLANLAQDWTSVAGLPPTGGLTPPTPIPACNGALTHNFNGATGQLQTGAVQVPLVAGYDGNSDVLWRDASGNVGMWLMNGSSVLQTAVIGNVPTTWSIVGQRDFNYDGNTDILWRDNSGNVGIWLMNGTTIASTVVLGNVPSNWSACGTGGFNGLSGMDIIWCNKTTGDVGIWFMNGTTIANTAVLGNMPTTWSVAGADNRGDIFWYNKTTGDVTMWVLNGAQIAKTVDLGIEPLTWTIAGIGDFDGNGSTDILWRDASGNVGIWLMNGTGILSSKVLGNVPLTWTIAQTGDYNGDGKSDILWTDSSGNVAVWFMNATTVSSVANYGNAGTNWGVQALNAE